MDSKIYAELLKLDRERKQILAAKFPKPIEASMLSHVDAQIAAAASQQALPLDDSSAPQAAPAKGR